MNSEVGTSSKRKRSRVKPEDKDESRFGSSASISYNDQAGGISLKEEASSSNLIPNVACSKRIKKVKREEKENELGPSVSRKKRDRTRRGSQTCQHPPEATTSAKISRSINQEMCDVPEEEEEEEEDQEEENQTTMHAESDREQQEQDQFCQDTIHSRTNTNTNANSSSQKGKQKSAIPSIEDQGKDEDEGDQYQVELGRHGIKQDVAAPLVHCASAAPLSDAAANSIHDEKNKLMHEIETLKSLVEAKQSLIASQRDTIKEIYTQCTCNICLELVWRPYILAPCGHIFCAGCLVTWFKKPLDREQPLSNSLSEERHNQEMERRTLNRKKICPACRTELACPPVEIWLVKGLLEKVEASVKLAGIADAALGDAGDLTAEQIDKIKGTDLPAGSKVWEGIFDGRGPKRILWDEMDHVQRCGECTSEIMDGMCSNPSCAVVYSEAEDDMNGFDSRSEDMSGDDMDDIIVERRLAGRDLPEWMTSRLDRPRNHRTDISSPEHSFSDDQDDGEMDDFIVGDDEVEEDHDRHRGHYDMDDSHTDEEVEDADDDGFISGPRRIYQRTTRSDDQGDEEEDDDDDEEIDQDTAIYTEEEHHSSDILPRVRRRNGVTSSIQSESDDDQDSVASEGSDVVVDARRPQRITRQAEANAVNSEEEESNDDDDEEGDLRRSTRNHRRNTSRSRSRSYDSTVDSQEEDEDEDGDSNAAEELSSRTVSGRSLQQGSSRRRVIIDSDEG